MDWAVYGSRHHSAIDPDTGAVCFWYGEDGGADVSFSNPARFVIFPEREDETRLCPGGNVFPLHEFGVRASSLIKSIFLPQRRLERGKTRRKRLRLEVGGYRIDSFNGVCSTSNIALFTASPLAWTRKKCALDNNLWTPGRNTDMTSSWWLNADWQQFALI